MCRRHRSRPHGYIDRTGRLLIAPRFRAAHRFSEGLAAVAVSRGPADAGTYGYVDRAGTFVIEPRFRAAGEFSGGLAEVQTGGGWGYIDPAGAYVWHPSR